MLKLNLTPEQIGRLEANIQIRELTLDKMEATMMRLPDDDWKKPMYESLINYNIESLNAICEILEILGLDWERDSDNNVHLIERSEENA